jgi:hypothetical protein
MVVVWHGDGLQDKATALAASFGASALPPICWSFFLATKLLAKTPFAPEAATVWDWGREETDELDKKCEDGEAHERRKEDSDRNRGSNKTLLDKNFGSGIPKERHASLHVSLYL